jgi:hypothetical protein
LLALMEDEMTSLRALDPRFNAFERREPYMCRHAHCSQLIAS